ncbi:hypothetical protein [Sphingomonas sp. IW22]|uniref:hypothetical protein n=1 Tax=Sphingomonas sp. IW22 TaxID=3242489 RepID=UPI0035216976
MASNDKLITTAASVVLVSDSVDGVTVGEDKATAFVVTSGDIGDETILNFRTNDSLINYRLISTEAVAPGPNGTIAVDAAESPDGDMLSIVAADGSETLNLRYLGNKDGGFAYADASVRLSGFTEGYVTNDTFDAASGSTTYFFDNALGLNLGFDTIDNFGSDDMIVTTRRIYDADDSETITFGANKVLDLSGEGGPKSTDGKLNPGGQIDVNGVSGDVTVLDFLYAREVNGVTYYHYGIDA